MRKAFFLICIFSVFNRIHGQQLQNSSYNLNINKYLSNQPASPNAAALIKYVGAGVSLNSGMVNYEVPIYQFTYRNIKVPISLKYSSNGVRVNDAPNLTGMGWVLDAGGVITRQRNGALDEGVYSRLVLADNVNPCTSQDFFNLIHQYNDPLIFSDKDSEPDMFTFNFSGYSGKFILDASMQAFLLPKSNLRIETNFTSTQYLYAFKITTPDGFKYYFGGDNGTEETMLNSANHVCQYGNGGNDQPVKTAFYLTKIENQYGDYVQFNYDIYCLLQNPLNVMQICNHTLQDSRCLTSGNSACPENREAYYNNAFYRYRILRSISVSGIGTVEFNYSSYNLEGPQSTNSNAFYKALTNIQVKNSQFQVIKNIDLNYSYVLTLKRNTSMPTFVIPEKSVRPFLISVLNGPEQYAFEYNHPEELPVFGSFDQDLWGFYNGQSTNWGFIPNIGINQVECPEAVANRNPYPDFAQYGILTKITSPTGGWDEIIYEGNVTAQGLTGGVRVKKILTKEPVSNTVTTKRFFYAPINDLNNTTISGSGVIPVVTDQNTSGLLCNMGPGHTPELATCTHQITYSYAINDLNIYGGNIVSYRYVTESFGGENFENGGIEHEFNVQHNNYPYPVMNGSLFQGPLNFDEALNGTEIKTTTYKKPLTGPLILIHKVENSYSIDPSSVNDRIISWKSHLRWEYDFSLSCNYPEADVIKTYYYRLWPHLDQTINTVFDENGSNPIITTESYYYENSQHLQLTRTQSQDSKGDLVTSTMKYPHDFTSPGNVYENMIQKNIISPIIEQTSSRNNQGLTIKSNYSSNWFGNHASPINVESNKLSNASESRVRYYDYDAYGNVLELSKENDIHVCNIWDYKHSLIVATVQNATQFDIAYTSFEADGNGGWSFSSNAIINSNAATGRKSYYLTGNILNLISDISHDPHIVSYWSTNNQPYSVTGTQSIIQGPTKNGLTYFEHKIANTTTLTIAGSGYIDEVRVYLPGSQMTTYTYDPLIGMTSQCDPNNRITYYIYDNFSRLSLIIDHDNNIVKKICYNFYNQSENCTSPCFNFAPNWQNTSTALRCQQGSCGNTGYQEQEQMDMNPCSQTYNTTRWILSGYNPTACPVSNCINLTSNNVQGFTGYTAIYYNTSTNITYTFSVSATTGLQPLGTVPEGNYTLTIYRSSGFPMYGEFRSGCKFQIITGTSATFYNVAVSATTCNSITINMAIE